jgi:cardiolipin synthase
VFLYKKGFIHAKTMVIDDVLSTVGTTNMDLRSFNINFETNAFIYNPEVCKQLKKQFNTDLSEAEELTLSRWEKRPITKRIIESTARLFAPVL